MEGHFWERCNRALKPINSKYIRMERVQFLLRKQQQQQKKENKKKN